MKYIRGTIYITFILSTNVSGLIKWWIYASYAVHTNMWGDIGGGLSMGIGFTIATSTNQNLKNCGSTESEIVGVHNCMLAVCWKRYFTEYQGYQVTKKIVNQDNKRTILLAQNGKSSNSKCNKHINISFFFITYRISNKELNL